MKISVQLFGIARELIGNTHYVCELPEQATVGDLLAHVAETHPELSALTYLKVAVNEEYAAHEQTLSPTDKIVFIPPVSGG